MTTHKDFGMRHTLVLAALSALALTACQPEVKPPPPPPAAPEILDFHASAASTTKGGTITLSWETKNATKIELHDSLRGLVSDASQTSGTVELSVEKDTLFVLKAENERGVRASAAAAVRVTAAPTEVLFVASPSLADAGQPVALAWSAPGATAVVIRPQGGEPLPLGEQLAEGSVTVTPEQDTTYELEVDGAVHTTTVTVKPVVRAFAPTPTAVTPGEPVMINWLVSGATQVTLSVPGGKELDSQTVQPGVTEGSFEVMIPADTHPQAVFTWRLTLQGSIPAAVTTAEITAYVSGQPRIESFTAPEYAREQGTFVAAWSTAEADVVRLAQDGVTFYESGSPAEAAAHSLTLQTPAQTTVYTLTAINHRGGVDTATVTVSPVGDAVVNTFVATPTAATNGGDLVTLTWNVTGARRLSIVANGEYTVFSSKGPSSETGSVDVYPNGDTTYELRADNTIDAPVSDSEDVTLATPALSSATPSGPVAVGSALDVAWTVGGTSDIYGFPHQTIATRSGSAGFVDIKDSGAKLAFSQSADDSTLSFTPDFETFLYGQRAPSKVVVSTNGFLVFGNSAASRSGTESFPSGTVEPNFVAPMWADLQFGPETGIYWKVENEAPERVLVVQWDRIRVFDEPSTELTFQARIHQTGVIDFEYQTVNYGTVTPVIGVQGPAAQYGLQHTAPVVAQDGLTFFGPTASPAAFVTQATNQPVGGFVKLGAAYLKLGFSPTVLLPGSLAISEVMFRPAPAVAANGEWIEIHNRTNTPMDLNGFELDFGTGGGLHTITAGTNGVTVVPPQGLLVLGQTSNTADNDGVAVQYAYGNTFTLDDTAGTVSLIKGAPVASISWTSTQGGEGVALSSDSSAALYASGAGSSLCNASSPYGSQSPQQLGTPGLLSGCYPYALSSIPGNFEVLGTGSTEVLASASDYTGTGTVTLPVAFDYYGQSFTSINLSMVGFGTFGPALTSAYNNTNDTSPSTSAPNGVIAPFWDEIVRNSGGSIRMERKTGYTIISWQDFRIYAQSSTELNFQMKLFDTGVIELHYGVMDPGTSAPDRTRGSSATAWIEDPTGGSALPVSINTVNGIQPNSGFRFTPY